MEGFEIQVQENGSSLEVIIQGYFNKEAGQALQGKLLPLLQKGVRKVLIDLAQCTLVNSPGVSYLLDMTIQVKEDFLGRLVLSGFSPLMDEVFTMAGIFPIAQKAATIADARTLLSA